MCERELENKQNCNILTPTLLAITAFLSRSPGLLNQRPGGPASLGHVPQSSIFSPTHLIPNSQSGAWGLPLLGAGFLYCILSPTGRVFKLTDFLSSPSYIIVQHPPSCCGHHNFALIQPVQVIISWSTGYTCYLHRCISYFDSPDRS